MSNKADVLHLYRQILRHLEYFQSKNREGMIKAAKEDFRDFSRSKDQKIIERQITIAQGGLERLKQYNSSFLLEGTIKPHHRRILNLIPGESSEKKWKFTL